MKLYGSLSAEELVKQKHVCYDIVSELNKAKLSNNQVWFLIYLLAMQVEEMDLSQDLCQSIRDEKSELFVMSMGEDDGKNT